MKRHLQLITTPKEKKFPLELTEHEILSLGCVIALYFRAAKEIPVTVGDDELAAVTRALEQMRLTLNTP